MSYLTRVLFACGVLLSCRVTPSPVVLQGAPSAVRALAGTWTGEYTSAESGREGSISMRIAPAGDSAFGDVTMLSFGGRPVRAAHSMDEHRAHSPAATVLRIVFVRVAGDRVSGVLEPYVAPDCECTVTTVFEGTVGERTITGIFVTSGATIRDQRGRWQAVRR